MKKYMRTYMQIKKSRSLAYLPLVTTIEKCKRNLARNNGSMKKCDEYIYICYIHDMHIYIYIYLVRNLDRALLH